MSTPAECTICASRFVPQFSYQIQRQQSQVLYFCSNACLQRHTRSAQQRACTTCGTRFDMLFSYQQTQVDGELLYFCSMECRKEELEKIEARHAKIRRIAVINQKGGTGKTTTSVNVAAAIASRGYRVLLIDLDAQGNVAVSLGLESPHTIYDLLFENIRPQECIVEVQENFDAIISDSNLARGEIRLVDVRDRDRLLVNRLRSLTNYDFIFIDCAPSQSLLNRNALFFADDVLIPVSCDYLSLVGSRQLIKTLKNVNEQLPKPIDILGVIPTFYDSRMLISDETVNTLKAYFKERVLHPVRSNVRLREAPGLHKTIFEHDPNSIGARDYMTVVDQLLKRLAARDAEAQAAAEEA